MENQQQTYNDGFVRIYNVSNSAPEGDMPNETISLKSTLRYHERTIGFNRYFAALQSNTKVSYLLRCPLMRNVSPLDVAIPNDGQQYTIKQIQYPEDVFPASMDLTLERVTADYDIR